MYYFPFGDTSSATEHAGMADRAAFSLKLIPEKMSGIREHELSDIRILTHRAIECHRTTFWAVDVVGAKRPKKCWF